MTETDPQLQRLLEADALRAPVLRSIIADLQLPEGSHGLDVGCGAGLQALQLGDAVGPAGHVTGLDIDPILIAHAERLSRQAGRTNQLSFRRGDMHRMPFADGVFDWAWSADCVGYPAGDLRAMLAELSRVLKPGGRVAILGWTSQVVLPGHEHLEARLNATCSAYEPFLAGLEPGRHFQRSLQWFQQAGFEDVGAATFVGDVRPPLTDAQRLALTSLLGMLWSEPPDADPPAEAAGEVWRESRQLCTPGSPDFILDAPGYYAFFTYTAFRGTVPGRAARAPAGGGHGRHPIER